MVKTNALISVIALFGIIATVSGFVKTYPTHLQGNSKPHISSISGGKESYRVQVAKLTAALSFPSTSLTSIVKPIAGIPKILPQFLTGWRPIALLVVTILGTMRSKITKKINEATENVMESGWVKRGKGGSFRRTIEVWSFAFQFLFKYVSLALLITTLHH